MESRDADERDISTKTGHTPNVGRNNKRCQGPYNHPAQTRVSLFARFLFILLKLGTWLNNKLNRHSLSICAVGEVLLYSAVTDHRVRDCKGSSYIFGHTCLT